MHSSDSRDTPILEQVFNLRDLGGHPTRSGGTVPRGRIYRSDDPYLSTEQDIGALGALGIDTVIDLRTSPEIADRGIAVWQRLGVDHVVIPLTSVLPRPQDHGRALDPEWTANLYMTMLTDDPEAQRTLWTTLADASEGTVAFHCASGRDRTGIVSALLLAALGVDETSIAEDYARSSAGMQRMLDWLTENDPEKLAIAASDDDAMRAFTSTPARTMEIFLERFGQTYEGIDAYAAGLGVQDAFAHLRRSLITEENLGAPSPARP